MNVKGAAMNKDKFSELYSARGYSAQKTQEAINTVMQLEENLHSQGKALESCSTDDIKSYIGKLLLDDAVTIDVIMALARYFYLENNHDIYIYFTKLVGGLGVLENIKKRTEKYAGKEITDKVFEGFKYPPLGTPIEEVPNYTKELMKRLKKNTEPDLYKKILAGNNHGVSEKASFAEKELYEKSESLEQYLKERHERKVAELQEYCDEEKVWFEQEITQPVVDFVKSNQEILSAVKKGNKLYVTKIPYDTVGFLKAKSDKEKNYYACHCTFARESIINESEDIPSEWCYCSAGFAKFPFEVILGRELKVKVLKSALDGDGICRFEIDLGKD